MSKAKNFCRFFLSTAGFCLLLLAGCKESDVRPSSGGVAPVSRESAPTLLRRGFACCNLHHDGERWRESNQSQHAMIPMGAALTVRAAGAQAFLEADGRQLRLEVEPGRLEAWLDKWLLPEDPATRVATWSAPVRAAVARGQLMKGMTREQVIAAAGYPQGDEKLRTDRAHWRYWWSGYVPYYVHWVRGSVSRVEAPSEILGQVFVKGGK